MSFHFIIIFVLLFLLNFAKLEISQPKFTSMLVSLLKTKKFSQCSLLIVHNYPTPSDVISLVETLSQNKFLAIDIFILNLKGSTALFNKYSDYKKSKAYCTLVTSFLEGNQEFENFYQNVAIGLPGLVKKNEDYFIFVMNNSTSVENLNEKIMSKIKHRIVLNFEEMIGKLTSVETEQALIFNPMQNLQGKILRVSTPLSTRWLNEMVQNKDKEWIPKRGSYKQVLELLESRMNFTSRHLPSTGGGTGAIVNGTWIGTVGDVLYDRADIGQVTAETWTRFRIVAHSFPISHEWLTFSTGMPQPYFSWRAVYRPLSSPVWYLVGVSIVIAVACFYLVISTQVSHLNKRRTWIIGILGQYIIGTMFEQDPKSLDLVLKHKFKLNNHSVSLRIFIIFWLLYILLISTAYRSKLVTFLAFPNVEKIPETFEELAANYDYKIGLLYVKGAAYQVLKRSKNPTYAKIFKRMSLEESDVDCFLNAVKEKFACISWDSIAEFVKHRNLTDLYGQSPVLKSPSSTLNTNAGLVMEKRAIFKEEIDNILRRITDTGILIKIRALDFQYIRRQRNDWLKSSGQQRTEYKSGEKGASPLKLSHFSGSLYIFSICIFISLSSFFLEIVANFRSCRKIET